MSTVTGYDSAFQISTIPANATLLFAYIDGKLTSGNYGYMRARFPDVTIKTITTTGTPGADVADGEQGDLSAPAMVTWALGEIAANRRPTGYWSFTNKNTYEPALNAAGITIGPGGQMDEIIAEYDGIAVIPAGAVGKQYASTTYDTYIVDSVWAFGPVNIPPAQGLTPEEEETMVVTNLPNGKVAVYAIGAGPRAGQLLEFIREPGDQTGQTNTVLDVTDQIGGPAPYTVSG